MFNTKPYNLVKLLNFKNKQLSYSGRKDKSPKKIRKLGPPTACLPECRGPISTNAESEKQHKAKSSSTNSGALLGKNYLLIQSS